MIQYANTKAGIRNGFRPFGVSAAWYPGNRPFATDDSNGTERTERTDGTESVEFAAESADCMVSAMSRNRNGERVDMETSQVLAQRLAEKYFKDRARKLIASVHKTSIELFPDSNDWKLRNEFMDGVFNTLSHEFGFPRQNPQI